jgi:hypothetical protein
MKKNIHLDPDLRPNYPLLQHLRQKLPGEMSEIIRDTRKITVPNPKIIEFVELPTETDIILTELDIYRNHDFQSTSLTDTDRLLSTLKHGDQSDVHEVEVDGRICRAALLTLTDWEQENVRRLGDVLWLAGTVSKNILGWATTAWPITLCDDRKEFF